MLIGMLLPRSFFFRVKSLFWLANENIISENKTGACDQKIISIRRIITTELVTDIFWEKLEQVSVDLHIAKDYPTAT